MPKLKPDLAAKKARARSKALRAGDIKYSQGFPCRNGHTGMRYTQSDYCVDCVAGYDARNRDARKLRDLTRAARKLAPQNLGAQGVFTDGKSETFGVDVEAGGS